MKPGTHVKTHNGPTNARIRLHLGIKVPSGARLTVAGEEHKWVEGKVIAFDDSFEHSVDHDGSEERVVLIADTWHPDLNTLQKRMRTVDAPVEVQRLRRWMLDN